VYFTRPGLGLFGSRRKKFDPALRVRVYTDDEPKEGSQLRSRSSSRDTSVICK